MDVLRGVRTLYISTMYIVDNQTVKNMYKPKSLENDKKLFLMTLSLQKKAIRLNNQGKTMIDKDSFVPLL